MWVKCRKCGFIFTRSQEPNLCVDCCVEYSLEEPTQEDIPENNGALLRE